MKNVWKKIKLEEDKEENEGGGEEDEGGERRIRLCFLVKQTWKDILVYLSNF